MFDKIRTKHKAVSRIVEAFSDLSPQVEKLAVTMLTPRKKQKN